MMQLTTHLKYSASQQAMAPSTRSCWISPQIGSFHKYQTSIRVECCSSFLRNPSLQSLSLSTGARVCYRKRDVAAYASLEPPPGPSSPNSWKGWIVGLLVSAILSFFSNKFGPLLKLKNEVETAVETAEHIAEVVEKVAEEVEKVAEEVADQLPKGGKLKGAVTFIENVAKETAKDAHIAADIIEKVEEVEKEVDSFIDQTKANHPS